MKTVIGFEKFRFARAKILIGGLLVLFLLLLTRTTRAKINFNGEAEMKAVAADVAVQRAALMKRYKSAKGASKQTVLDETRSYVEDTLVNKVFPAWMGMPWTMAVIKDGLKPDAKYPGEPRKGVSCSWFVVRTLQNAGFRFSNPREFAGTIAIHFQNATTPNSKNVHRLFNITAKQLEARMVKKGDGLYIIGLNCHIGFVHVRGNNVVFIHSNYMSPWEVTREPLATSKAIVASEGTGFVVSSLFKDAFLLQHWLGKTPIPFKKKL